MADIYIERAHGMRLTEARQVAQQWAELAREKYHLQCTYREAQTSPVTSSDSTDAAATPVDVDTLSFERAGVSGVLTVTAEHFALQARLGFLFSAFQAQIEAAMRQKLDALIERSHGPDTLSDASSDA